MTEAFTPEPGRLRRLMQAVMGDRFIRDAPGYDPSQVVPVMVLNAGEFPTGGPAPTFPALAFIDITIPTGGQDDLILSDIPELLGRRIAGMVSRGQTVTNTQLQSRNENDSPIPWAPTQVSIAPNVWQVIDPPFPVLAQGGLTSVLRYGGVAMETVVTCAVL